MPRNWVIPAVLGLGIILGLFLRPEFFDPISLLLTVGGAAAVTCLSYSRQQLFTLCRSSGELLEGKSLSARDHFHELRRLTELFRLEGIRGLENQERHLQDSFLRCGVELLVDLHNEEKIRLRLEHKLASFIAENEINRQILMTLGKLLPSFGLIGTLIGMVLLLSNISTHDPKALPAALGLSVLTTLYGAVAANVLVAPLLARLQSVAVERETNMRLTKDWIVMIARGETATVADRLKTSAPVFGAEVGKLKDWEPIAIPAHR